MDLQNPYVISIMSGLFVYFLYNSNKTKSNKEMKQTRLNYSFLTSILVFIFMHYYNNNTSEIEPVLTTKFDE